MNPTPNPYPKEESVLLYHFEPVKQAKIMEILKEQQLKILLVPDIDCGKTLAQLLSLPTMGEVQSPVPDFVPKECMILAGLHPKKLDPLLKRLREESLQIPLKAVLTSHNQSWRLDRLIEELAREREVILNK